eukprot:GHRR01008798.1.p1 GENE.GHRR01008798.1~~GHRR01008798.1.p1  ORF type:complete len:200 (+),score=54.10 GHRR01008798.1:262-861(+)
MADVAQASTGEPASPKDKPEQQLQQAEASDSAPQAHAAAQPAAETSSFASQAAEHGAAPDAPQITFKVQYGKNSADLKRPASSTVGDLKAEVEKTLSIPPSMQKLMYKGLLKNDTDTLEKVIIVGPSTSMQVSEVFLVSVTHQSTVHAQGQSCSVEGFGAAGMHAMSCANGFMHSTWPCSKHEMLQNTVLTVADRMGLT